MEMLGRYRITGRIGAGSFATVYNGRDDTLDVPVAIKVLADNWATNDDVRARFLAEARVLRRLGDERIVRVYDIGTTDRGQPYFVMDLADGGSLDQLRKHPVAPGLALRLCAEACRALDVLHRNQYRPAVSKEKQSPWVWLWLGLSAVALLVLAMIVTVYFLTP